MNFHEFADILETLYMERLLKIYDFDIDSGIVNDIGF